MYLNSYLIEVLDRPGSAWSTRIHAFRAEILRQMRAGKKSFMLTSSWEGEGKSSVLANLAAAIASMGISVTLLDLDLRVFTLSKIFGCESEPGMREAIEAPATLQAYASEIPGLDFVPAGNMKGQFAAELCSSSNLARVIKNLSDKYACVLVDSPPLAFCKDAVLIGRCCDGAYMVVREDKFIGYPEANLAEDLLDNDVALLGVIVNASRKIKETAQEKRGLLARLLGR